MIDLKWLKRKDGVIFATHKKDTYTISIRAHNFWKKSGLVFTLSKNNVRVYDVEVVYYYQGLFMTPLSEAEVQENKAKTKAAKDCLKEVATRLAMGKGPVFQSVLATIKNKDKYNTKGQFIFTIREVYKLDRLPKITGPGRSFFEKHAANGLSSKSIPIEKMKAAGLDPADLSPAYLDSLYVELFPIWRTAIAKQARANKALGEPAVESPTIAKPIKVERKIEVYNGERPDERSSEGLEIVNTMSQLKCGMIPDNAKFSTLLKWAEKVRDWHQVRGQYASIEFLLHLVSYAFSSWDRICKATDRLQAIYSDEYKQYQARIARMIENSNKPIEKEESKPKRGQKDKWGNRLGTNAAKVNAVFTFEPMSPKQIKKLSGVQGNISSHLAALRKRKLIFRLEDGSFRLRKHKKK